jgi:hypothetical protein
VSAEVVLPQLPAPVDQLWHVLLDVAEALRDPWTLIGGQMVLLHALEHGQTPPQVSQDGDVVADVRASPTVLGDLVATLEAAGFDLEAITTDGRAHRYLRPASPKPVVFDVLAPEGLGERTNLVTTPPGRTVSVPGGTQALARTQLIAVRHEDRTGVVPRPSLLGALVLKAAACGLPGDPARHLRDVALLLALLPDPFTVAEELTKSDRKRLRLARALADVSHPAWVALPGDLAVRGQQANEILRSS